jgi:uncharacterized protein (DUF1697 family)
VIRFVAFLRAINVGGRVVAMADLRRHFEAMGFAEVETFIASGNVIFKAASGKEEAIAKQIETGLEESLGYEVGVFLRSIKEVAAVAAYEPFPPKQSAAAEALNVAFLAKPLTAEQRTKLAALETEIDTFHTDRREVYWLCLRKQSESKFSNRVFEKALGLRATFRGISSVRKLAAKLATSAG